MTRSLRVVTLGLFIMICMQSMAGYGQDFDKEYIIHPLVGAEIDRAERDKYRLFPETPGFQSASAYKIHNNRYYLAVTVRDEKTGLERSSLLLRDNRAIQKIRLQIDGIGRILNTSTLPPGMMLKKGKIVRGNKVGVTSELLQHPRRFFVLNSTYLSGIGSDKTEWKSAYSMGANIYYSLSDKVAIGYRFAFTQCAVSNKYDIIPALDRYGVVDLSKYHFDAASGYRAIIEVMPSIRVVARRTRNTILSMQYGIGVYLLRRSDVKVQGYYWEGNKKSVLSIATEEWLRETVICDYYYFDDHTRKTLAVWELEYLSDNMGLRNSKPVYSIGLSYNIKNIIDIQPTFIFASREFNDLSKFKNCYFSITLSLIVPEEIITNPPKPMPQN